MWECLTRSKGGSIRLRMIINYSLPQVVVTSSKDLATFSKKGIIARNLAATIIHAWHET
jgi:hypothetical protein